EGYIVLERPGFFRVLPQGSEDEVRRLNPDDIVAELDLSKAHPGSDNYPIQLKTLRNYNLTWDPKMGQATVTVDTRVQNVRKPVVVRTIHQLRDPNREYVANNTTTNPGFVYVSGPKSLVD